MSVKHTPGPWVWVKMDKDDTDYPGVFTGLMAGDVTVLTAEQHYADMCWVQVSEANGRLIAAAPELLAFATEFIKQHEWSFEQSGESKRCDCAMCDQGRIAIAKVEMEKI